MSGAYFFVLIKNGQANGKDFKFGWAQNVEFYLVRFRPTFQVKQHRLYNKITQTKANEKKIVKKSRDKPFCRRLHRLNPDARCDKRYRLPECIISLLPADRRKKNTERKVRSFLIPLKSVETTVSKPSTCIFPKILWQRIKWTKEKK